MAKNKEEKEKRAFDDRHASTQAYIDFIRPRCVELHRVLKQTGSCSSHIEAVDILVAIQMSWMS